MEDVEGDQWAFLAKGLPLHKPIGLDNKTMLFLKRALFLHSFVVGAGVGVGVAGLTDIKNCCLIRLFYSGQLLCSCFSIESCLASSGDFCVCAFVFSRKMEVEEDKSFPSIAAVYFHTGMSGTQLGSFLFCAHLIRLC